MSTSIPSIDQFPVHTSPQPGAVHQLFTIEVRYWHGKTHDEIQKISETVRALVLSQPGASALADDDFRTIISASLGATKAKKFIISFEFMNGIEFMGEWMMFRNVTEYLVATGAKKSIRNPKLQRVNGK